MLPVVQNRIITFNSQLEGYMHHMYRDVKGFVTVGVGNLLSSAAAASALPFTHGLAGALASPGESAAAWNAVNRVPAGKPVDKNGADSYGAVTDLRLGNVAIDALVIAKALSLDALNPIDFPGYASFPADAQLGLISMRWPGGWSSFVKFIEHVKAERWFGAARECFFNETGNRGLIPRNAANRRLFSNAGRVVGMDLAPGTLFYDNPGANKVYFFKDDQYVRYDWDSATVDDGYPGDLTAWRLPAPFSSSVDATFNGLGTYATPKYFGKTYFTHGSQYVRYDWDSDAVDVGPAALTAWGLRDAFADKIDAAVNGEGTYFGKLYFFRDDQYVRYDWGTDKIDQKPRSIADGWQLPAPFSSGIDAAVSGEGPFSGKLYFFKGDQCIRCNWDPYSVDGPSADISDWKEFAGLIASDLSAACNAPGRS